MVRKMWRHRVDCSKRQKYTDNRVVGRGGEDYKVEDYLESAGHGMRHKHTNNGVA